jgi:hypothetical protein
MNDKIKKNCKVLEGQGHNLTHSTILDIYLKRMRKAIENLSQCLVTQLRIGPVPPKYRPTALQPQKFTWLENKALWSGHAEEMKRTHKQ